MQSHRGEKLIQRGRRAAPSKMQAASVYIVLVLIAFAPVVLSITSLMCYSKSEERANEAKKKKTDEHSIRITACSLSPREIIANPQQACQN